MFDLQFNLLRTLSAYFALLLLFFKSIASEVAFHFGFIPVVVWLIFCSSLSRYTLSSHTSLTSQHLFDLYHYIVLAASCPVGTSSSLVSSCILLLHSIPYVMMDSTTIHSRPHQQPLSATSSTFQSHHTNPSLLATPVNHNPRSLLLSNNQSIYFPNLASFSPNYTQLLASAFPGSGVEVLDLDAMKVSTPSRPFLMFAACARYVIITRQPYERTSASH